jgi:hypothetical protein
VHNQPTKEEKKNCQKEKEEEKQNLLRMPLKLVQLCAKYICRSLIDYAGRFRYSTYFPTLPSEITHLLLRTLEEHGLLNLDTLKSVQKERR